MKTVQNLINSDHPVRSRQYLLDNLEGWYGLPVRSVSDSPEILAYEKSVALLYRVVFVDGTEQVLRIKLNREAEVAPTDLAQNPNSPAMTAYQEFQLLRQMEAAIENSANKNLIPLRALGFLPGMHGIVMEELAARTFRDVLFSPAMRIGFGGVRRNFLQAAHGLGCWLKLFHNLCGKPDLGPPEQDRLIARFDTLADDMFSDHEAANSIDKLRKVFVGSLDAVARRSIPWARQHGDFYFSNLMIADGKAAVLDLDPRKHKYRPIYVDISTFLAEMQIQKYQIINFGFLIPESFFENCQEAFLDGYFDGDIPDCEILDLYRVLSIMSAVKWYRERISSLSGLNYSLSEKVYFYIRRQSLKKSFEFLEKHHHSF